MDEVARLEIELVRKLLMERFPAAAIHVRARGKGFDVEFLLRWSCNREQRVLVAWTRLVRGESAEQILTPLAFDYLWLGHSIRAEASGTIVVG